MDSISVFPVESYRTIMTNPQIYVVNYLPDVLPGAVNGLTQIFAGRSALVAPPNELTDVLVDGASLPNDRWAELSAIYKIWREGPKSPVVGFCHYRRFLNFKNPQFQRNINRVEKAVFETIKCDLYDKEVVESVDDQCSIVARELFFSESVYDWYARCHDASDYLDMFKILTLHRPDLARSAIRHFERNTMFGSNIFILSWDNFVDLCTTWFSILGPFSGIVSWPRQDPYQSLDVAFLAERIFDIWMRDKVMNGHKVREFPVVFVDGLRP